MRHLDRICPTGRSQNSHHSFSTCCPPLVVSALGLAAGGAGLALAHGSAAQAATACAAAWSSTAVYTAGMQASESGINYTANWWTQGNNPATNNGGPGSGQPWTSNGSCAGGSNLALVPYPGAPAGAEDAYIKQSDFPSCMANGLPLAEARELAATQRPLTTLALTQKSGVPAWQTIPSWAVIGTADHAIPPAELLAMARQAHAHITMAPGAPHLSMIYDPGLVTSVILQALHATT